MKDRIFYILKEVGDILWIIVLINFIFLKVEIFEKYKYPLTISIIIILGIELIINTSCFLKKVLKL